MSAHRVSSFWNPLFIGTGILILSLIGPRFVDGLPAWATIAGVALAVALFAWASVLAYRSANAADTQGGRGGSGSATGGGTAIGGDAGNGLGGGHGGSAKAKGKNSVARGGRGGSV